MSQVCRRFALAVLLLLVCSAAGCISEKVSEGSVSYSFAWWVPLLTFVGGIAMLPAGWATRSTRYGWMLLVGGPVLLAPAR